MQNFQLIDLETIDLNYIDTKNKKIIQIFKKRWRIFFKGKFFNVDNLIESLLNSKKNHFF